MNSTASTRNVSMQTAEYTLRFLTPAFLGDAEQNARWRTPPIKHALREWWRVAYAADRGYDINVADMRREEGLLFGHAWLEGDLDERGKNVAARQSRVRLRLLPAPGTVPKTSEAVWGKGNKTGVEPLKANLDTSHAWFGLIKRGNGLPDRNRLEAEEARVLALAYPDNEGEMIARTLRLMHRFATLGSRSRGGWGSVHIEGCEALTIKELRQYAQPLDSCLERDWAAALGNDDVGLMLWQSRTFFKTWDEAMAQSARWRREVRGSLKRQKDLREALGFAGGGRMPSPLRWKLLKTKAGLVLQAAAFPHSLPKDSGASMSIQDLRLAWRSVAAELDTKMNRAG